VSLTWINVLKKYIKHLSELASIKLFIIRYIVNFIIFLEIIYLPIVLSKESYVQIEYFKNIIAFLPILLLGINSGYINSCYRLNIDKRKELLILGIIISLISSFIVYLFTENIFFSIASFCFVFTMAIEKILVVDGYLILSSVYKAFFSIVLILFVSTLDVANSLELYYSLSIIIGFIIWIFFVYLKYKNILSFKIAVKLKSISTAFFNLFKEGFVIAFQSFVLIGYFLFDRWFILNNYPEYIGEYSISFSFAQIVFIALNTIAFSMQKKLGENLHTYTVGKVNNIVKINIIFFVVISIIAFCIIYLVIYYNVFKEYGDFLTSFVVILLFYGFYYTLSTYNVIALYSGLSVKLLMLLMIAFLVNILITYMMSLWGMKYIWIIIKSGIILTVSALVTYKYVIGCLQYDK